MAIYSAPAPPTPVPSPPPFDAAFERDIEKHYHFHGSETRIGHTLYVDSSPSSSPTADWRLSLRAIFLSNGGHGPYSLGNFPAHLVPFFAYRDVAVYIPEISIPDGRENPFALFDTIYREWYPTRDRTVFNNGIWGGCGSPFFSSTIRLDIAEPIPQPPALLELLVRWHTSLVYHLRSLFPRFRALDTVRRVLARPELTLAQLVQALSDAGDHYSPRTSRRDYTPIMQRTFAECFLWVEKEWEDKGVRLVVLNEDMLRRISSNKCEGLTRDVDLEEQLKQAASVEVEISEEQRGGVLDEHVSVWRGGLIDVMRAVVAGDDNRKGGLRDFNIMLEEWLGEGVNVGK